MQTLLQTASSGSLMHGLTPITEICSVDSQSRFSCFNCDFHIDTEYLWNITKYTKRVDLKWQR